MVGPGRSASAAIAGLLAVAAVLVSLHSPVSAQAPADPRHAAATELFSQGFKAFQGGNYTAAIEKFETGLSIDPNAAAAHYYLAESLRALGRSDEALPHYELAARLGPNTKEGILAAAIAARERGRVEANRQAEEQRKRQEQQAEQAQQFASYRAALAGYWCLAADEGDRYEREILFSFSNNNVIAAIFNYGHSHTIFGGRKLEDQTNYRAGRIEDGKYIAIVGDSRSDAIWFDGSQLQVAANFGTESEDANGYRRCDD